MLVQFFAHSRTSLMMMNRFFENAKLEFISSLEITTNTFNPIRPGGGGIILSPQFHFFHNFFFVKGMTTKVCDF